VSGECRAEWMVLSFVSYCELVLNTPNLFSISFSPFSLYLVGCRWLGRVDTGWGTAMSRLPVNGHEDSTSPTLREGYEKAIETSASS